MDNDDPQRETIGLPLGHHLRIEFYNCKNQGNSQFRTGCRPPERDHDSS